MRPELAADEEFLGMFSEEARIALRLHHPNIVQTYEIFEEEGQHLMAMEYLDGQSLADLLRRVGRENMPLEEHLWILTQVLAALHHAHEMCDEDGLPMAIVHRDVSPSNVFLTYNGDVKLVDFGIAKASGAVSTTARGTVKAKLGYGAPEQFLGNPIDARADIFSVGVMMWEALAGCRRKIGETRNAMIEARITGQEPSIRAIRPEIPAALAAVCDRATALDPEKRHGSAAELAYDIERCLQSRSRQAGRPELAALVCSAFQDERMAMRARIESELGGSDADPTRDLAPRAASALLTPGAAPSVAGERTDLAFAAVFDGPGPHAGRVPLDRAQEAAGRWRRRRRGGSAGRPAAGVHGRQRSRRRPPGPTANPPAWTSPANRRGPRPRAIGAAAGSAGSTLARTGVTPTSTLGLTDSGDTGTVGSLAKPDRTEPARKSGGAHHRRAQPVAAAVPTPAPSLAPSPSSDDPAPRPAVAPPPVAAGTPGATSATTGSGTAPSERPSVREVATRTERPVPAGPALDRSRKSAQPGDDLSRNTRNRSPPRRQLDEQDPYK